MKQKIELQMIPIGKIHPNPKQPREKFDREELQELANSLKSVDLIQPIRVRKFKGGYQIIFGERRWKAAQFAGFDEILAIVEENGKDEIDILLESLIENMHRKDLTSTERENAIYELWSSKKWKSHGDLGNALGKSASWIQTNIESVLIRKKGKISSEVSTKTIFDTKGLEEKERVYILKKVESKKIEPGKVRELVEVIKKAPKEIKEAIIKEKVDVEDVKSIVDVGIPEKKVPRVIEEFTERKKIRELEKKAQTEIDRAFVKDEIESDKIKLIRSRDEQIRDKILKVRDTIVFMPPTTLRQIQTEKIRKECIGLINDIIKAAHKMLESVS